MSRRAQVKQVFIYLGALFVIGAIITIGFQATTQVQGQACEASLQEFRSTLFSALDTNRGPGNAQRLDLNAPCDITTMCAGTEPGPRVTEDLVNQTLDAAGSENIFLLSNGDVQTTYSYDDLADEPARCLQADGNSFTLTVRGSTGGDVAIRGS